MRPTPSVKEFLLSATACVKTVQSLPQQAGGISLPEADMPVIKDLGNGLCVVYLVDQNDSLIYVQNRHLSSASFTAEGLHELGLYNLAQHAAGKTRMQQYGDVYGLFVDGMFEASLILLEDLWEESLASIAPNGFIATLPSRDVLAVCDAKSVQGIESLRDMAKRVSSAGGEHLLTPDLYQRQQGKWVLYR